MEDVNDPTQERPAAAYHDGASRHEEGRNGESRNGTGRAAAGGVQSIERAFDLLEMLADAAGRSACPSSPLFGASPCPQFTG